MTPAPYAADPARSRGRLHPEPTDALRGPRDAFQRDRDRIIHSRAFRRLQYKTQVFVFHEGDSFRTAVTMGFPRPIDVGFTVRRTQLPSFLQGLFMQDIRVGDPEFDDLYCVTGHPEPYVRALLARPRLLEALKYIGARTTDVQMNHLQFFFRVPGPSPTAHHLVELAELARRRLHEVHALATHYHWSEHDILRLPARRRAFYLLLIADAAARARTR